tara:strand:- start:4873 stop:5181 length:309 start_codon:yes stop_codon:yes gene_type:complete
MASRDECIICFNETYDSGDRVTINMEVDEIVSIVKTCKCKFKVHETCFLKWIKKKPICPYCREAVTIKVIQSNFRSNRYKVQALFFLGFIGLMVFVIVISGS